MVILYKEVTTDGFNFPNPTYQGTDLKMQTELNIIESSHVSNTGSKEWSIYWPIPLILNTLVVNY